MVRATGVLLMPAIRVPAGCSPAAQPPSTEAPEIHRNLPPGAVFDPLPTMNCQTFNELLDARLDERLTAAERAAFEAHYADCPACAVEWLAYAGAWQALEQQRVGDPSIGFTDRTMRRLTADAEPLRRPAFGLGPLRWFWLGTAVSVLAVAAWVGYRHEQRTRAAEMYVNVQKGEYLEDLDVIAHLHELGGEGHL